MPSRSSRSSSRSRSTVRLLVAYDGTRYAGWQQQRHALTVQATLEAALRQIVGHHITVMASGRTDAGVHAWGQVAHATVTTRLSPGALCRALNALTPSDILIRRVTKVPATFHARFNAVRKRYRYRIATGPLKPLFERSYVHFVPQRLDVPAMRWAAKAWVGHHDFRAFHSTGRPTISTRRHVYALRVTRQGREVRIDVEADGFLYHMVRRMVGVLLEVGKGRWAPHIAQAFMNHRQPSPVVAPTAPAKGLCLVSVRY